MKPTLLLPAGRLFAIGVVIGWLLSPFMVQWMQDAAGREMVAMAPVEPFVDRLLFALGLGTLLAAPAMLSRWVFDARLRILVRPSSFQVVGMGSSFFAALYLHSFIGATIGAATAGPGTTITYVSMSAVPVQGIPVFGCGMMLLFGLALKMAGRDRMV